MTVPSFTASLRYPYEAITDKTDYLQIGIYSYDTFGYNSTELLANQTFVNQDAYSADSIAAGVTKNKVLGAGGVIMLPMPSNIQDSNSVSYEAGNMDNLTAAGLALFEAGANIDLFNPSSITSSFNKGKAEIDKILGDAGAKDLVLKSLGAQAVNIFGANVNINSLLAREQGKILNPNMELLFNSVTLRTFKFSFKMTPRDRNESVSIKSIIRTLKKNMAAKTAGNGTDPGLFLKTPNIFELTYMKGNKKHPFLNRFKPCALTDINVNYTGENVYATYGDGTPVSMIMTLTFKELVPVYEDDYTDSAFDDVYEENTFSDDDLVYGVDGTAPNGVQRDVEGVGY